MKETKNGGRKDLLVSLSLFLKNIENGLGARKVRYDKYRRQMFTNLADFIISVLKTNHHSHIMYRCYLDYSMSPDISWSSEHSRISCHKPTFLQHIYPLRGKGKEGLIFKGITNLFTPSLYFLTTFRWIEYWIGQRRLCP